MALKKQTFKDGEIAIYDEALISKRGNYWYFRMWLQKEGTYARRSLRTRSESTAIEKAKQCYIEIKAMELEGKTYHSKTTKQGVEEYLKQRWKDHEAGLIVIGRYRTIATHLQHWLNFINRDTKLKELERTDCENYYHERTKTKKAQKISQTTVENEQSTINAMMNWLYKAKETYIDGFDFKKLPRVDTKAEDKGRYCFSDGECKRIRTLLEEYAKSAAATIDDGKSIEKFVTAYYLLISMISGLRRGEQQKLRWQDMKWYEHDLKNESGDSYSLVEILVRGETSKTRKTRRFMIKDWEYFESFFKVMNPRYRKANKGKADAKNFGETLIFSVDGNTELSARAIAYHFDKIMELADIGDTGGKDLVPYCFRHTFITQRVNAGLSPTEVSEIVGNLPTQIEKTYYHTTRDKMISNALATYSRRDGMLIPK